MLEIFVFGSNEAGRHGKGAALFAKQNKGAVTGQGRGLQGKSYAIPTKDYNLNTRSLPLIAEDVEEFLFFAAENLNLKFEVTKIGCGLAGYSEEDIKPMFKNAPHNCNLPNGWR